MLRLILLILGTSLSCVWLAGCSWGDPFASQQSELNTDIYIAVDVESSIDLTYTIALRGLPTAVLDMKSSKSSGLEWREVEATGSSLEFELLGTKLGTHDLTIRYSDQDGQKHKQTFQVHVVEHHHSDARIPCDGPGTGSPYLVAPGSSFSVWLSAYDADEKELPLADPDLVEDADGFERGEGRFDWIAPEELGTYTWTLAGNERREVEFIVYDPAQLIPRLIVPSRSTSEQPSIQVDLGPELKDDGGTVCSRPLLAYVDLEVTDGQCLPTVGPLAFEDGLSVDVSGSERTIGLDGSGECSVRATSASGMRVEETLNADVVSPVPAPDPYASDYRPLRGNVVSVVDAPKDSLVADRQWAECSRYQATKDTRCPDYYLSAGDRSGCIREAGWTLQNIDLNPDVDYPALGAGLTGELTFRLDAKGSDRRVDGLDMPPTNLTFSPSFDALVWSDLGCTKTRRVVQYTISEPGTYEVKADAFNATKVRDITLLAHAIAQTTLTLTDPTDEAAGLETERVHDGASSQHWFVGEQHTAQLAYFNEEGELLRGLGLISARSSEEDSGAAVAPAVDYGDFGIFAGSRKNLIEVGSPHAPSFHRIFVEDADGIAGIEGVDVVRFREETRYCAVLHPLAEDGLGISGTPPEIPRVRGTRGTVAVTTSRNLDGVERTCFRGHVSGDAEVTWSWGAAEQSVTWTVE